MKELLILALGVAVAFLGYDSSRHHAALAAVARDRDQALSQQRALTQERDEARAQLAQFIAAQPKPSQKWLQQRVAERAATLEAPSFNHSAPVSAPSTTTAATPPAYTTATGTSSRVYFQDATGRFWVDVSGSKHYE